MIDELFPEPIINKISKDEEVSPSQEYRQPVFVGAILRGGKASIGAENKVFKFEPDKGIWLGNTTFSAAPFQVGMDGDLLLGSLTGSYIQWDGSTLTVNGTVSGLINFDFAASANIRNTNDTAHYFTETSYTKIKEILLNEDLPAVRVQWDMGVAASGTTGYAKVYKNGVAVGTQKTTTNYSGFDTVTDDLTGFSEGDLLQIYAYTSNGSNWVQIKNMKLCYDQEIASFATPKGTMELATNLAITSGSMFAISVTNQDP